MKKTIQTIFIAFIIGVIFSYCSIILLKDKISLFDTQNTVTAFQVGVYKSKENAENTVADYPGAIAVKDGDYYRVYIAVAKDKNCEEILENYFLNQDVKVYAKEIEVTNTFLSEIKEYEKTINKEDIQVYEKMNRAMMKKLAGEIL